MIAEQKLEAREINQIRAAHLFDVFNTLDDVAFLNSFFDSVGIAQDGQVFLQGLLDQSGGKCREMGQIPKHLQHLRTGKTYDTEMWENQSLLENILTSLIKEDKYIASKCF